MKMFGKANRSTHSAVVSVGRKSCLAVMKSSPPTTLLANAPDSIEQQDDVGYDCGDKENHEQRYTNRKDKFGYHHSLSRPTAAP
jgi:hypothetical protein